MRPLPSLWLQLWPCRGLEILQSLEPILVRLPTDCVGFAGNQCVLVAARSGLLLLGWGWVCVGWVVLLPPPSSPPAPLLAGALSRLEEDEVDASLWLPLLPAICVPAFCGLDSLVGCLDGLLAFVGSTLLLAGTSLSSFLRKLTWVWVRVVWTSGLIPVLSCPLWVLLLFALPVRALCG